MNTHLQYAGLFYVAYVAVFFFLKKKTKSLENKLYGGMIVHTILMFLFNIVSRILIHRTTWMIPITILTKINLCLMVGFLIKFALYIHVITSEKNVEFIDLADLPSKEYFKKQTIIMRIVSILVWIIIAVLPITIEHHDTLIFYGGPSYIVWQIASVLSIISWILIVIFAKDKSKKRFPVYFYIAIAIFTMILQYLIPGMCFISVYIGFIVVLIYNTIENPDVNLIKELQIAKQEADLANKSKTEFLSRMSHEIRTPLNAIVGFGKSLTKEDIPESAKEEATDIIMASNTLLDIVNGILDIQKIEANKVEIVNDEYKSKRMINEVTSLINARIGSKQIDFKILIDENLPAVMYGDVIRIKQIMTNLLTNSIKYTNEGRILFQIKANNENDICKMTIEVADTGIGMTEESIEQLFNKYERFDIEKNANIEGTGLGMAIIKGLIDLMNGEIKVKSKYGEGTTFTVTIEQKIIKQHLDEFDDIETTKDIKAFNASGSKVLVVDDNKINLKVAERLLKDYQLEVETAMSGAESIDKVLNGNKYDIIFMDIMMPKMNGVEALNNLRSIVGFDMPVVALTADVIAGMEDKYISQGFDDCLAKPIVEEQLYYMLKKYCKEGNNPVPVVEQPVVVEPAEVTIPTPIVEEPPVVEQPVIEPTPVVETQPQEQPAQPSVQIVPGAPHTVELLKNNNIDVDAGIELLKDMEMYNMTLEEFYNELQNKLTDLENYKNEGNMEDYAILAHALKTEARYVGCTVLGDLAYEHELAGKENNQEKINQKFEELKTEATRIYEVVKTYFGN